MVGPGFFGFSGYPWPGPPFASPTLKPTYGCYFTRARLKNAWRAGRSLLLKAGGRGLVAQPRYGVRVVYALPSFQ